MIAKKEVKALFDKTFGEKECRYFYSPGRVEIMGNHTDHNHGQALTAAIDRGITAAVAKNNEGCIQIASEGYRPITFYTDELVAKTEEKGTTMALAKGVLRCLKDKGYEIGGFQAALKSDIQAGSGLSSSASLSCLIAKIIDCLYGDGEMDPGDAAEAGRFAENVYFGKSSGLLDQTAIAYGGVNHIDFADNPPTVNGHSFDCPFACVLINTGSSHEGLDDLYASIPGAMKRVANELLGVDYLGQVSREEYLRLVPTPKKEVSEYDKLKATHFYEECRRVYDTTKALMENDPVSFLTAIRESQFSMTSLLMNTMVPGQYEHSPQQCVDIGAKFNPRGAMRMNGGGFAGSVLAYVPKEEVERFIYDMSSYYGQNNVYPISWFKQGPVELK